MTSSCDYGRGPSWASWGLQCRNRTCEPVHWPILYHSPGGTQRGWGKRALLIFLEVELGEGADVEEVTPQAQLCRVVTLLLDEHGCPIWAWVRILHSGITATVGWVSTCGFILKCR